MDGLADSLAQLKGRQGSLQVGLDETALCALCGAAWIQSQLAHSGVAHDAVARAHLPLIQKP